MTSLPHLDADAIRGALDWPTAVEAIAAAVATTDPAGAVQRAVVPLARGELMLMPGETDSAVGVKVLSIAPGNPARGLPRIQAVYVLFDGDTLTPTAVLDGAALTTLRTAAVSAFAARTLARPEASILTVFGSGPQAEAHIHAIRSVRPLTEVTVVGRDAGRAQALAARVAETGLTAEVGTAESVRRADIVVCATTASQPVFDGDILAADAFVIAVGSHQPDVRELDDAVFRRAERVVVEDVATALREAGDVIQAIDSGVLQPGDLIGLTRLKELADSDRRNGRRAAIAVFKSVGMGWQDLALAAAAWERISR